MELYYICVNSHTWRAFSHFFQLFLLIFIIFSWTRCLKYILAKNVPPNKPLISVDAELIILRYSMRRWAHLMVQDAGPSPLITQRFKIAGGKIPHRNSSAGTRLLIFIIWCMIYKQWCKLIQKMEITTISIFTKTFVSVTRFFSESKKTNKFLNSIK